CRLELGARRGPYRRDRMVLDIPPFTKTGYPASAALPELPVATAELLLVHAYFQLWTKQTCIGACVPLLVA
ncbi:MAG TPA: hypothetical protein VH328_00015, partial [Burkholderiaceae bacterium]|nr:hypothetical protein [Burkholderiaceae bacterium]